MSAPAEETHFGYKQVPLSEKQGLVDDVFHKKKQGFQTSDLHV